MEKRIGSSIRLPHPPSIRSFASIVGQKEGDGPLGHCFDRIELRDDFGEKTCLVCNLFYCFIRIGYPKI